jgi:ornithine cyclodeaminase
MALIGNGAQSEFQALGFQRLLGIRELRLYDVDPTATDRLVRNLRARGTELELVRARSAAEAAQGADILTTVTADKRNAVIVTPAMVRPGMHLNAVGGDCPGKTELHADVLKRPDARVVVEYEPQSRIEGDVQQLPPDFPVTEFARVVRGEAPGRVSPADVTIFDSVGFALEDFSALRYLHRELRSRGVAQRQIDLLPELDDPKDLYSVIDQPGAARRLRAV